MRSLKMKGAQMVVRALELEGVEVAFGIPGGAVIPLYDALYDSSIAHILARHEQAACHAADGYARVTGKPGVCIVTSGPGAMNALTGLATAYMDSIPLIVIAGQVARHLIGSDAFQEADIYGSSMPVTKHNFLVRSAGELPSVLRASFYIATTGRRGPVLITLPSDVQQEEADFLYPPKIDLPGYRPNAEELSTLQGARDALSRAERPLILAGGGVIASGAAGELITFAEAGEIPVSCTLMGKGAFPESHRLFLGMMGMHGRPEANLAASRADLLVAVGTKFSDRTTGFATTFAPLAKVIHVDLDPAEIDKNIRAHFPLVGDARKVLRLLTEDLRPHPSRRHWFEEIESWREAYPLDEDLLPAFALKALRSRVSAETVVTTEVGQHQMWAALYWQVEAPRTFITSGGLGTMGFGLPAAVGASLARPGERVICIAGDGSILMNAQELETCARYNLPVKVFVFNNSSLGMVRQWQELFWDRRYAETLTDSPCDFAKLAQGYGVKGWRAEISSEVESAIDAALSCEGPALVDILVPREELVMPMVPPGRSLTDFIHSLAVKS